MKVALFSDLHLEFEDGCPQDYSRPIPLSCFNPPLTDIDVLVLAGDIGVGVGAVNFVRACASRAKHVVYVFGNHEFYGNRFDTLHEDVRAALADCPNVHVLEKNEVIIDNVRFLGATLWTDLNDGRFSDVTSAAACMSDYSLIWESSTQIIGTAKTMQEHKDNVAWLTAELHKPFAGKTVVVTHHLPSKQVHSQRWNRSRISAAYYSTKCDNLMGLCDYWFCGHQHESIDKHLGSTHVVSNPRGYIGHEVNPLFEENLVLEI